MVLERASPLLLAQRVGWAAVVDGVRLVERRDVKCGDGGHIGGGHVPHRDCHGMNMAALLTFYQRRRSIR